jgi:hypothetical protein
MSKGHKLANGLTPDEERYAALLAEGMTQSDAYRQIWPAKNGARSMDDEHTMASRKAVRVRSRVQELIDAAAKVTVVNVITMTEQLDDDRTFARECKNPGAAVSASVNKAKLHGLLQDRQTSAADTLGALADLVRALDNRPGDDAKLIEGISDD